MAGGLKKLCNTQIYGSGKGKQYGAQPIESVSGPHAAADGNAARIPETDGAT